MELLELFNKEAYSEGMEARPETMKAQSGAVETHSGAVEAHPWSHGPFKTLFLYQQAYNRQRLTFSPISIFTFGFAEM